MRDLRTFIFGLVVAAVSIAIWEWVKPKTSLGTTATVLTTGSLYIVDAGDVERHVITREDGLRIDKLVFDVKEPLITLSDDAESFTLRLEVRRK